MRRIGGLSVFCAVVALAGAQPEDGAGLEPVRQASVADYDPARMHAIVIGINAYQRWPKLQGAAADARAVASTLHRYYGYPTNQITVLLDRQATRRNLLATFDRAWALSDRDSLLIYYAGHGWKDDAGNGYWIPADAEEAAKADYVSNNQLVGDYFKKYKVRHLLVVADSCFSGAMLRGSVLERTTGWQLPAGFSKPSRLVLTSGDIQPVSDGTGEHSPFAERFLQYLQHGDQRAFGVQDIHAYVRKNLATESVCAPIDTPGHMPGGELAFCRLEEPLPDDPYTQQAVREREGFKAVVTVLVNGTNVVAAGLKAKRKPEAGEGMTIDFGDGVKLEMVFIPAGGFVMGSPDAEVDRGDDEVQHRVMLTNGFWMGRYEVTQELWTRVMGYNPANFKGDRNPVEQVGWDDCQAFIRELNGLVAGGGFRLPSEEEWEYACRAGTSTPFHYGASLDATMANFDGNYPYGKGSRGQERRRTMEVGSFQPNGFGLFDMHGNVDEWCLDWYGRYPTGNVDAEPAGAGSIGFRVFRGGNWGRCAKDCRAARRHGFEPVGFRRDYLGLRLVKSL